MKQNRFKFHFFLNLILALVLFNTATAQEKKVASTSAALYKEIEQMDEIMFEAFNKKDFEKFKSLFTEDLEWFQDNGGLLSHETVFKNFSNMFKNENKLTRKLVKGTLEVHPIKDYGAIEIGVHEFRHMENGKEEIGTFKFLMIWKKKDNQWKISRVISYDH
ncbi:nuclear transport factor 2 family protein [Flavobacterium sp. ZE23DGlu08]|uniref:nuclear transport factor 2 family protein n=1 Tax=Flavobacterium sp. ZE23DGlu08 TaxID=3059026 RepID=UPI002660260B|nr:nuclear transport factor 2 family protein [Flavobacterium sp. ZE23DGlu08]WKL44987.1 nuclear transport factor 2 family protein [Flavobacterium sp. ZE23DGlu08]